MELSQNKLKYGLQAGIKKGWSGFVWMLKIIMPVSFLSALIEFSGFINKIDFLLEPVLNLLNLSPMAALPLIEVC